MNLKEIIFKYSDLNEASFEPGYIKSTGKAPATNAGIEAAKIQKDANVISKKTRNIEGQLSREGLEKQIDKIEQDFSILNSSNLKKYIDEVLKKDENFTEKYGDIFNKGAFRGFKVDRNDLFRIKDVTSYNIRSSQHITLRSEDLQTENSFMKVLLNKNENKAFVSKNFTDDFERMNGYVLYPFEYLDTGKTSQPLQREERNTKKKSVMIRASEDGKASFISAEDALQLPLNSKMPNTIYVGVPNKIKLSPEEEKKSGDELKAIIRNKILLNVDKYKIFTKEKKEIPFKPAKNFTEDRKKILTNLWPIFKTSSVKVENTEINERSNDPLDRITGFEYVNLANGRVYISEKENSAQKLLQDNAKYADKFFDYSSKRYVDEKGQLLVAIKENIITGLLPKVFEDIEKARTILINLAEKRLQELTSKEEERGKKTGKEEISKEAAPALEGIVQDKLSGSSDKIKKLKELFDEFEQLMFFVKNKDEASEVDKITKTLGAEKVKHINIKFDTNEYGATNEEKVNKYVNSYKEGLNKIIDIINENPNKVYIIQNDFFKEPELEEKIKSLSEDNRKKTVFLDKIQQLKEEAKKEISLKKKNIIFIVDIFKKEEVKKEDNKEIKKMFTDEDLIRLKKYINGKEIEEALKIPLKAADIIVDKYAKGKAGAFEENYLKEIKFNFNGLMNNEEKAKQNILNAFKDLKKELEKYSKPKNESIKIILKRAGIGELNG